MIWLFVIVGLLLLFAGWLLVSPFIIEIDSRIPEARFSWFSIGTARLWYDGEWRMGFRILFFTKTMQLADLKGKTMPNKKKRIVRRKRKQSKKSRLLSKGIRMIRTFRVKEWQLAIDTGDYARTAKLFPLNYSPYLFQHLQLNFRGENYLVLKVVNRPANLLYAYLR